GGYVIPPQTLAPGALLLLDQTQLGFRPRLDDRVFLYNASRDILFDAAAVRSTVRARSGSQFLSPTAATFGAENTFSFQQGIVINEVMYHFPPNPGNETLPVTANPEEWIELYNRTTAAIDIGGWKLEDAIAFTFPPNTVIPAGGYLVVARDAAALAGKWSEMAAKIIGNFSGTLSNSGERIVLSEANGNPADQIRYFTGGAWPAAADGNGTSLELRNPDADNGNGAAWAAGNPTTTAWQTVTYRMTAGQAFGQTLWNEFRIGMLDAGECLIDDLSLVRDPAGARQELIQGGNFETLAGKWRMLGNHGKSAVEAEPGNGANHVLHVRASGQFGFNHNHIESTFLNNTALVDGQTYEVTFRARWIAGTNQLNTRAYYSRLARTTQLALPARIGTPGTENARFTSNIGPTMSDLAHWPLIPSAGEPVSVSVVATDPDSVAGMTLRHAFNGSTNFTSTPMTLQGNGRHGATILAQPAGTIVQFYVEAIDGAGALSQMPAAGPKSRALYQVNNSQPGTVSAHEMRVIMLPADSASLLAFLNRVGDERLPGTAIYRRDEVFYDVGIRLQGTAAGRIRDGEDYTGYDIGFPADHLFRGLHDSVNIDRSGRSPTVRGQDEIYVKHLFHRAGLPCSYDDLCYFVAPTGIHTGTAILQMAGYEQTFLDSQFEGDGSVFSLDGTYEPSSTAGGNVEGFKNPVPFAPQLDIDFTNLGADKEQYRAPLEPRAGRGSDDFSGLIAFCQTMARSDAELASQISTCMDVDEWMRCAALYSLCGIADCYMNGGFKHNLRIHVPANGRNVTALPWDMDFVFNVPAASQAILAGGNLRRVIELPAYKRLYYGHLHDLCQTTFTSAYMTPWMAHYGSVVDQNMSAQAGYIDARRASVLSQLPAQTVFAITTNNGASFSINASTATLNGSGWINIREFRRADTGA
ncbi:MAG: lamin tail domain-containing protein, partial [Verrucomicrobiota bacterium]